MMINHKIVELVLKEAKIAQHVEQQTYASDGKEYNVADIYKLTKNQKTVNKSTNVLYETNKKMSVDEGDLGPLIRYFDIKSVFGKRALKSSLKYPLLITENDELIDGAHRLAKAYYMKHTFVKCFIVTKEQLRSL